jgi:hypothetical protein
LNDGGLRASLAHGPPDFFDLYFHRPMLEPSLSRLPAIARKFVTADPKDISMRISNGRPLSSSGWQASRLAQTFAVVFRRFDRAAIRRRWIAI